MPAANSTLAIGGVSSPLDSFVVAESSVLRINFCAESLAVKYNPILQIQFILNLDDTFALNTISLLNPSKDIIVDSIFGSDDLIQIIYSDQSLSKDVKKQFFMDLQNLYNKPF